MEIFVMTNSVLEMEESTESAQALRASCREWKKELSLTDISAGADHTFSTSATSHNAKDSLFEEGSKE